MELRESSDLQLQGRRKSVCKNSEDASTSVASYAIASDLNKS
jgi:hypothetical protein